MANITAVQQDLLERLLAQKKTAHVRWNEKRGVAASIKGSLGTYRKGSKPNAILRHALRHYGPLIGPEDILKNCRVTGVRHTRDGGLRIRGVQLHDDLPLYGGSVTVFADGKRGIRRILSTCWRDVEVTAKQRVDEKSVQRRLLRRFRKDGRAREAEGRLREQIGGQDSWAANNFPLANRPVLWLYETSRGFHPAFQVLSYEPVEWLGVDGKARSSIDPVEMMIDAATGRTLWKEPTREGMADVDTTASGWSTLEDDAGNHLVRTLQIIQRDGGDYYLINRDQTPHIITHDAGGTESGLVNKLKNDNDISTDADGVWDAHTNSCTAAQRVASQQPEVDAHFYAERTWQFYQDCGWSGFDDGNWGDHCPIRVVAHIGADANAYFSKYTEWDANQGINKYYGYLAFYDGECRSGSLYCDFIAGDPVVFGHEYQHAITFFGAAKSDGQPGHLYGTMWLGAIREGYSDSFGCLLSGLWKSPEFWRAGALRSGQPFRRVEFPRSTDTDDGDSYFDHYDDRDSAKSKYYNSTILSHAAFLAGEGGVHQRIARSAELIPVSSIGRERAAEIFLHALTEYFDQIPTGLSGPTLIEAGQYILDAAEDVSGSNRTCEYVMMRRALYATGLYPYDDSYNKVSYGGEACMLPWTIDWQHSRSYLGFPALWYKSPDLFIHNGSGPDYDADVGAANSLFARVRNIGDEDLSNVIVRFYFRAYGTNLPASSTQWRPCQDSSGTDCVLTIPTLAAGSMNFSDENNPPASQGVEWFLDASEVIEDVDHFCVRAEIECTADNHDNDCPNYVQSNVSFSQPTAADALGFTFMVANWAEERVPLDLDIDDSALPDDFELHFAGRGSLREMQLDPGKEVPLKWKLTMPAARRRWLKPPYEGEVSAKIKGEFIEGELEGVLSDVKLLRRLRRTARSEVRLTGLLAGRVHRGGRRRSYPLLGRFQGVLDRTDGRLRGRWTATLERPRRRTLHGLKLELAGELQPTRAIHFTQRIGGKRVGGVTYALRWPKRRSPRR